MLAHPEQSAVNKEKPLKGLLPSFTSREPEQLLTPSPAPLAEVRPWMCLSCQMGTLVAEQVQVSTLTSAQPMLWLRPVVLRLHGTGHVWNMSQSADLVWPATDCQPAYAEEVLPWLAEQQEDGPTRQLLNQFLQQLWKEKHLLP
ncbi:MAG: hypothetical protein OHK0012_05670 [Synechococcales cyanobacterium]